MAPPIKHIPGQFHILNTLNIDDYSTGNARQVVKMLRMQVLYCGRRG